MLFDPGDQWDQTLIGDLLAQVDTTGVEVCLIPGRYWVDRTHEINERLRSCEHVLAIITGDEEGLFPTDELDHPSMQIWLQSPHHLDTRRADVLFPIGYTPGTHQRSLAPSDKTLRWFFAGQNADPIRDAGAQYPSISKRGALVDRLRSYDDGVVIETAGFLQGLPHTEYLDMLAETLVAPCPSGTVVPDTFRLYEALELGCVPIVEGRDQQGNSEGYWEYLLDETPPPFPVISTWDELRDTINFYCDIYPRGHNRVQAWWQSYKRELRRKLQHSCDTLTGSHSDTQITVIMSTSPIPTHPSTHIIEETLASVTDRLPDAEILIMIDGIHPDHEHQRTQYERYIERLLHLTNRLPHATPILFDDHEHQARMTRHTLTLVDTPQILFVEHDTPLEGHIPFDDLSTHIGQYDVIRFHHESEVLPDHRHLMVGDKRDNIWPTAQWSQRPHLASTDYYRRLLSLIHEDEHTMIEDAVHGIVQEKFLRRGYPGWLDHKVGIYHPEGNIRRSHHLDGRHTKPEADR